MHRILSDLKLVFRQLRQSPGLGSGRIETIRSGPVPVRVVAVFESVVLHGQGSRMSLHPWHSRFWVESIRQYFFQGLRSFSRSPFQCPESGSNLPERRCSREMWAVIASTIGVFGLLLATMGIYGTVSYIVMLRTREVGIRRALGAKRRDILGLMLRTSTRPVIAGLLVGMVLAMEASYLLRGVLYGLHTVDGISFARVSLLFLVIALLAAYLPSRRAMRVDPMAAFRYE